MRRLVLLLSLMMVAVAATAYAADTSLSARSSDVHSALTAPGFFGSAWLNTAGCSGKGQLDFQQRGSSSWNAPEVLNRRCDGATLSDPVLTRDPNNHHLFVVWSQASLLHPKLSGIRFVTSSNGGRSWTQPKLAVMTPHALQPVYFSAAALGDLWVMYERDSTKFSIVPAFSLIGYNERSALRASKDLTAGRRGSYHANLRAGAVSLYATTSGLLASWQLTDIGGQTRTYVADTGANFKHMSLTTREQLNAIAVTAAPTSPSGILTFSLGEDGQLYLLAERRELAAIPPIVTFDEWHYSFAQHRFLPLTGATSPDVLTMADVISGNIIASRQGLALGVDAQHNSYLIYTDYTGVSGSASQGGGQACFTGTWPCTRGVGGATPPNTVFVLRRAASNGALSRAAVPFPFSVAQPTGDNIVEWIEANSGLESVTTQFGGVRTVLRNGWEDITISGAIGQAPHYNVVFSDPLSFLPYSIPVP